MIYTKEVKINLGNYNMGLIRIEDIDMDSVMIALRNEVIELLDKGIDIDDNVKKFVGLL